MDKYGNPVGQAITIPLDLEGLSASKRDALIREAITQLIHIALQNGCEVIVIEDLNFQDARDIGKETMGRGKRGKKFRKTVCGMPTAQFRNRLVAMAYTAELWVIAVDPAYTTRWGKEHWLKPLQEQASKRKDKTITAFGGRQTSKKNQVVTKDHASAVLAKAREALASLAPR